jgi:hypothetical protein
VELRISRRYRPLAGAGVFAVAAFGWAVTGRERGDWRHQRSRNLRFLDTSQRGSVLVSMWMLICGVWNRMAVRCNCKGKELSLGAERGTEGIKGFAAAMALQNRGCESAAATRTTSTALARINPTTCSLP